LNQVLHGAGILGVDGVLIDAGLSSMQIDRPERGFSFQEDGPLDMRMDQGSGPSAAEWLAAVTEETLATALRDLGDVGPARRVAKAILERQRAGRMTRTGDLAEAVRGALDFVRGEPAEIRTVFQAVRIAVNRELECLRRGLEAAVDVLNPGGRLVVISFHSGEDRVVKDAFRAWSRPEKELMRDGRVRSVRGPRLRLPVSGPILPSEDETRSNPRAKSAKMRVAERRAAAAVEE
jgi:16S rRNA (cytosine1402-N4)-methyltransferase